LNNTNKKDRSQNMDSSLDSVIGEIKNSFRAMGSKSKELILKLGNELARTIRPEDICEEIKHILNQEIREGLISAKTIERYCLDNWKKKTKPKKQNGERQLSFPKENQPIMITTSGKSILEDQDSNNNESKTTVTDDRYEEVDLDDAELVDTDNPHTNVKTIKDENFLDFEFSLPFDKVRSYLIDEFSNNKGIKPIWFHGRFNRFTGIIITADLGRITDRR
jgi:hypothetical protein